jgi:hypothetical protein
VLRSVLIAIPIAAITLAAPISARANPAGDIAQAWRAFGAVKSYHAEVKTANNRDVSMDVIVPNKMHVTMSQGMQMIRIDGDTWVYREGSWMKLPVAMPQFGAIGDTAKTMGMKAKPDPDDYTITYLGPAVVSATPAQHYRIARKDNSTKPVEMWIGSNHLPLQVMTQGDDGPVTVLYSNYNAVAPITAPM